MWKNQGTRGYTIYEKLPKKTIDKFHLVLHSSASIPTTTTLVFSEKPKRFPIAFRIKSEILRMTLEGFHSLAPPYPHLWTAALIMSNDSHFSKLLTLSHASAFSMCLSPQSWFLPTP